MIILAPSPNTEHEIVAFAENSELGKFLADVRCAYSLTQGLK
jgi:hypothetical protein